MSFDIEGKLYRKFETEQKTDTFQAREFVLEIQDGNYPQLIKFQLVQDRCSLVDSIQEGDKITVSFDLRGREWNGKFFTNLNAWKIEETRALSQDVPADDPFDSSFPSSTDEPPSQDLPDDLPF